MALVLTLTAWLPAAPARSIAPVLAQAGTQSETEKNDKPAPAFQYLVATLSTFLVLTIICKPSRKG
jgi:hypothetical protein